MKGLMLFDACEQSMRRYGGSDKKTSILINKEPYMIKFNDKIDSVKRNDLNSSYRNSVISEYLSCHIIETLGVEVQKTELGYFNGKIAVACKDFCEKEYRLNEFEKYQNSIDFKGVKRKYVDIYDVMKTIESDAFLPKEKAIEQFWDMFVIDAFLGNFDRHTGNWGYLVNEEEKIVKLAPIYDCGACLYPMISDEGIEYILNDEDAINERIFGYPKSAFSLRGERVSYHSLLESGEFSAADISLLRMVPKIDLRVINDLVKDTPTISQIRKDFYSLMLEKRFEKILEPAFEKAKQRTAQKLGCEKEDVEKVVNDIKKLENGTLNLMELILADDIRAKQVCQLMNLSQDSGLRGIEEYEKDL